MSDEGWLYARNVLKRMTLMNKATAKAVSELMMSIGAQLNESIRLVKSAEDEAEFQRYRDTVSRIMTLMLLEVMNPLYAEHPELKPPELR